MSMRGIVGIEPALGKNADGLPVTLRDRLTMAWLNSNGAEAEQLVARIKIALG
jgi:hypothetical protein